MWWQLILWYLSGLLGSVILRDNYRKYMATYDDPDVPLWCISPFVYCILFILSAFGLIWLVIGCLMWLLTTPHYGLTNSWFFRPICKKK